MHNCTASVQFLDGWRVFCPPNGPGGQLQGPLGRCRLHCRDPENACDFGTQAQGRVPRARSNAGPVSCNPVLDGRSSVQIPSGQTVPAQLPLSRRAVALRQYGAAPHLAVPHPPEVPL